MPNFEEIPNIELSYTEEHLIALKKWCEDNVTKDVVFQNEPSTSYQMYVALAKSYIEFFNSVGTTRTLSVEQIQHAVKQGYHYFLENRLTGSENADALNMAFKSGMTPLHIAASNGFLETLTVLLAKGAKPDILNQEGQLPLHSALLLPMCYSDLLIQHKITIFQLLFGLTSHAAERKDKQNNSIAHLIARYGLLSPQITIAINTTNKQGEYPIHLAIQNKHINIVRAWLTPETICQTNLRNGQTTLHYLAHYGTLELIQQSLPFIENIDTPDREGRTPLMIAAAHNTNMVFECLLKHGAQLHTRDHNNQSAIDYAKKGQDKTIFSKYQDKISRYRPS